MSIYFVVTIDTECDKGENWKVKHPFRFDSVTSGIPNVLDKMFTTHEIKATYLLSPEVIADRESAATLKALKNAELGTHLHCEFIAPEEKLGATLCSDRQSMYPYEIEFAKMKNLTELFKKIFEYDPVSFRGGRFGIGLNSTKILQKLNYLVDSSVTPHIHWDFQNPQFNFLCAPDKPYFPLQDDPLKGGGSGLLEVPVTIFSSLESYMGKLNPWVKEYLSKIPYLKPIWLRPTYASYQEMKYSIDNYIKKYSREKNIVLNMMFHSVEVVPGANPYNLSQIHVDSFLERTARILSYLKSAGIKSVTLKDLYTIFSSNKS